MTAPATVTLRYRTDSMDPNDHDLAVEVRSWSVHGGALVYIDADGYQRAVAIGHWSEATDRPTDPEE